mgnify:CR=1 FL=1
MVRFNGFLIWFGSSFNIFKQIGFVTLKPNQIEPNYCRLLMTMTLQWCADIRLSEAEFIRIKFSLLKLQWWFKENYLPNIPWFNNRL